jgi:haloacid dehalogenase-like hydrolase
VIDQVRALPLAVNVDPDEAIVDLAPAGVTKRNTLAWIGDYAAFGNDSNDIAMLRDAGLSVCVGSRDFDPAFAVPPSLSGCRRTAPSIPATGRSWPGDLPL